MPIEMIFTRPLRPRIGTEHGCRSVARADETSVGRA
jgi:hypothetical protein